MTVQPSNTFLLHSGNNSPDESSKFNSKESSPFNINGNCDAYSDMGLNGSLSAGLTGEQPTRFNTGEYSLQEMPPQSMPASATQNSSTRAPKRSKWPCQLTVDPTPDKSRVETQIPIKLNLHNCPAGYTKLHLPAHTISKAKFVQKPPFEKSKDTLELSTMLFCASALQKEGVRERAFRRAETGEVPVRREDSPEKVQDENDPEKPLNGGPVTICQGCVVRERKRAARKKTKKADEEEEWAKHEAKRVVVFNCPETRDWCIPQTKEIPVKDTTRQMTSMYVNAPMRIACYCRHQTEKLGFQ